MGSALSMICSSLNKSDKENVEAARHLLCGAAATILSITTLCTFLHRQVWNLKDGGGRTPCLIRRLRLVYYAQLAWAAVSICAFIILGGSSRSTVSDPLLLGLIFLLFAVVVAMGFVDEAVEIADTGQCRRRGQMRPSRRRSVLGQGGGLHLPPHGIS